MLKVDIKGLLDKHKVGKTISTERAPTSILKHPQTPEEALSIVRSVFPKAYFVKKGVRINADTTK